MCRTTSIQAGSPLTLVVICGPKYAKSILVGFNEGSCLVDLFFVMRWLWGKGLKLPSHVILSKREGAVHLDKSFVKAIASWWFVVTFSDDLVLRV